MAKAHALSGSDLVGFDTATPANGITTALTAGETLVGIDSEPGTTSRMGSVNATADTAMPYGHLGADRRRAGRGNAWTDRADGRGQSRRPAVPATVGYGFDFDPAADRIRIVAGRPPAFTVASPGAFLVRAAPARVRPARS